MPFIVYKAKKFGNEAMDVVSKARAICDEYAGRGYDLTLRQLYYQFVARGFIPNKQSEYKRLGTIVNDARMSGLIDWNHLVDRTRNVETPPSWSSPASVIEAVARQFRIDKWKNQPNYVEVWVEKEALAGVVERIGETLQVPTLACRGYMSQSEQWAAAQRLGKVIQSGRQPHIIHLGDHDPSGIDMTRDNDDRLTTFLTHDLHNVMYTSGAIDASTTRGTIWDKINEVFGTTGRSPVIVNRIALNMDQVEEYDPPPNPAKLTDARANGYIDRFGDESWELDALPPDVLSDLIETSVLALRDDDLWSADLDEEDTMRTQLAWVSDNWQSVAAQADEGTTDVA